MARQIVATNLDGQSRSMIVIDAEANEITLEQLTKAKFVEFIKLMLREVYWNMADLAYNNKDNRSDNDPMFHLKCYVFPSYFLNQYLKYKKPKFHFQNIDNQGYVARVRKSYTVGSCRGTMEKIISDYSSDRRRVAKYKDSFYYEKRIGDQDHVILIYQLDKGPVTIEDSFERAKEIEGLLDNQDKKVFYDVRMLPCIRCGQSDPKLYVGAMMDSKDVQ